jgi:hypothetical protein
MNFLLTASGAEYHLDGMAAMGPKARPILLRDVAHQLALINRFAGATWRPYSVAEHSLLVSEIAQRKGESLVVQLAALLHDAHEAYTTDLIGPVKAAINERSMRAGAGANWRDFEAEHAREVRRFFGVLTTFASKREVLHRCDMEALATERRDLTSWNASEHAPWSVLGDGMSNPDMVFEPLEYLTLASAERTAMTWQDWRSQFFLRFESLMFGMGLPVNEQAHG